jgi:hypothetical protein
VCWCAKKARARFCDGTRDRESKESRCEWRRVGRARIGTREARSTCVASLLTRESCGMQSQLQQS